LCRVRTLHRPARVSSAFDASEECSGRFCQLSSLRRGAAMLRPWQVSLRLGTQALCRSIFRLPRRRNGGGPLFSAIRRHTNRCHPEQSEGPAFLVPLRFFAVFHLRLRPMLSHGKINSRESRQVFPPALHNPTLAISSRGLGRRPLTAETRVRIPVSLPNSYC
jgi:hypothetical protein